MRAINGQLAAQLKRSIGPWQTASTLPAQCYVDEDVYAIEQEQVFRQGWVGIGRSDRWSNAGDYSAMDIGGVPVVVARDHSGELQAVANVCSHRASQVVTGEGNAKRLRCPFHYWTYDLDGRFMAAPSMNETPGFESDKDDLCLATYAVAERFGFAFVSLEAEPPPIDDWLADFGQMHTPWPIADLVTARRREFTVDCNWKAFAEVFNEYYHLPYVHPTSIDDIYLEPDAAEDVTGAHATQFGMTEGTGGLLESDAEKILPTMDGLEGRSAKGVRYTWIFPNIMIAAGAEAMWMYEVYPDGPDRCLCAQVVAFPSSTFDVDGFEEKAAAYYERFDVAVAEDIPMLEQQLAGQRSPQAKQGRYSYLEPSVARFGSWYAERLLAAESSGQA